MTYENEKRISNSSLSYFKESPLVFKKYLDDELKREEKKYHREGTMIHQYILERDNFDTIYKFYDYDVPSSQQQKDFCEDVAKGVDKEDAYIKHYATTKKSKDKIAKEAESLYSKNEKYINFLQDSENDKVVLSNDIKNKLEKIYDAIINHRDALKLLFPNQERLMDKDYEEYNEYPIYWKDPIHGLDCKSKIDRLIVDHKNKYIWLIDVKTTSGLKDLKEKIRDYDYDRQLAFYWMAIFYHYITEKQQSLEGYTFETFIIFIKKNEPIEIAVRKIGTGLLNEGEIKIREILSKLQWHVKNDKWDYDEEYYLEKYITL